MMDSESVLVKHNEQGSKSGIKADYIIYEATDEVIVHYFIERNKNLDKYFGKTFFTRQDRIYLRDRPYKVLKKTKIKDGCVISQVISENYEAPKKR